MTAPYQMGQHNQAPGGFEYRQDQFATGQPAPQQSQQWPHMQQAPMPPSQNYTMPMAQTSWQAPNQPMYTEMPGLATMNGDVRMSQPGYHNQMQPNVQPIIRPNMQPNIPHNTVRTLKYIFHHNFNV